MTAAEEQGSLKLPKELDNPVDANFGKLRPPHFTSAPHIRTSHPVAVPTVC
jgi:hypothetical protein